MNGLILPWYLYCAVYCSIPMFRCRCKHACAIFLNQGHSHYIFKWFLDIIDQRFKNVVMHFIRQLFQLLFAVVFNLAQIFFNGFLHNWFDLERGFDCLVVLLIQCDKGENKKKIRTGKDTVENNEPCTSSTMSSSMSAGSNIPSPIFQWRCNVNCKLINLDDQSGWQEGGKSKSEAPSLRGKITSTIKSPSKELERVQKHVVQRTPSLVLHGEKNIHS